MRTQGLCITVSMLVLSLCLALAGCSGSGMGGADSETGTTVITGKVSLSASLMSGKPTQTGAMVKAPSGKPGTKTFREQVAKLTSTAMSKVLLAPLQASSLSDATVDLYDADHPEWLMPIASSPTDQNGNYTLSKMINALSNAGSAYQDGDPIPAGKYTLVAHKETFGQKPLVAVQTLVKEFVGDAPPVDFEILPSDVPPAVVSMFGASKNMDGTQTWGTEDTTLPATAAIQITFSMPMVRNTLEAIDIQPSANLPPGRWTLSANWLTATYYPDAGQQLTEGTQYTVTIYGDDDTSGHAQVTNVYGNPIEHTAVGTFTVTAADTFSPTVQWNTPTVIEMGAPVDVTQAFRIEASEMLDVNGVTLQGTGTTAAGETVGIGVKPGVMYMGKTANGMYKYEFELGEPLMLATSYKLRVSGGKDLSGNQMNELSGSIVTNDAENTPGISLLDELGNPMSPDAQNLQAQVKAVFGKWARAMNDRNIAQVQSMMSGDFYMEYDVASRQGTGDNGIDAQWDLNRDGRYSLAEFSAMMLRGTFVNWENCGSTLTGEPVGTINVVASTNSADLEFTLTAVNLVNSQRCNESAPKQHLYTTLKYFNGAWRIVRASIGVDTRNKPITNPNFIPTQLYQEQFPFILFSAVDNGGVVLANPTDPETSVIKYSWDAVPGVQSYVLIIVDANNPKAGKAYAFPTIVTSARTDKDWVDKLGGQDVSYLFGLNPWDFHYVDGGRYYWEVLGFGTTSARDFTGGGETGGDKTTAQLLKDITATSSVSNFIIAGVYKDLYIQVRPGNSLSTSPLSFSETAGGYNVGDNWQATVSVYTPNVVTGFPATIDGTLTIQGSSQATYTFSYDSTGKASKTIVLYQGINDITVTSSGNDLTVPPMPPLVKNFRIVTTNGIPPVLQIWNVTDDMGNTLSGNMNYYLGTTGAKQVTITGGVTDPDVPVLNFNLWNEMGAQSSATATVYPDGAGNNVYSATMDIYDENNWINISGSSGSKDYSSNLGVFGNQATEWIPPIRITAITTGSLSAQYPPYSEDWTASPTEPTYDVTVSGSFKSENVSGHYSVWGVGDYQSGDIVVNPDGTFSFTVTLYTTDAILGSWNYINIYSQDETMSNWYGVNVLTTTGKPVMRPTITAINSDAYDAVTMNGVYNAGSACMVTISGTARPGSMYINWDGYDGSLHHGENLWVLADASNAFSVTMPVVGGTDSYNYFTVYDNNWLSTTVVVVSTCTQSYSAPGLTVDQTLPYDAGTSNAVTLSGTSSRPGTITATLSACSSQEVYQTTATGSSAPYSWTISGINVYGLGNPNTPNTIYVQDGYNSISAQVNSSNTNYPPEALNVVLSGATKAPGWQCGSSSWTTSSLTVGITGTTSAPDGTGEYYDPINGEHDFTITNGSFSIPNVSVYNGSNTIYLYDTMWNSHTFQITSTNGIPVPHFVTITSPASNATVSGTTTISGSVQDPTGTGYNPSKIRAQVWDAYNWRYTYYSSNSLDQQKYGDLPITYSGGMFSFQYNFVSGYRGDIWVTGEDLLTQSHGAKIYVNSAYAPYFWKPGAKKTVDTSMDAVRYGAFLRYLRTSGSTE